MHDISLNYWKEGLAEAASECGLVLTAEQLTHLAEAVKGGNEHYGMAFDSPPPSDRLNGIESEWKQKFNLLQGELDRYRDNAGEAVKKALGQHPNASVSIGNRGTVTRHGGRSEIIQY